MWSDCFRVWFQEGILACFFFFFFNDTATTEIYTLSLHDALPILASPARYGAPRRTRRRRTPAEPAHRRAVRRDRKSTRLNSSHSQISYAVFCLKKKTTDSTPILLCPIHTPTF